MIRWKSSRGFVAKRLYFTSYWCFAAVWWMANHPMMRSFYSDFLMTFSQSTTQILRVLCARWGARSFARTEGQDSEFLAATRWRDERCLRWHDRWHDRCISKINTMQATFFYVLIYEVLAMMDAECLLVLFYDVPSSKLFSASSDEVCTPFTVFDGWQDKKRLLTNDLL